MAIKFIGYKRSDGSFTNEKTGEVVNYDNFYLYFAYGGLPDMVGFYPSTHKIKTSSIRNLLDIPDTTDISKVFEILNSYLNKDVLLSVVSIDDKPVVTNLSLAPPKPALTK